MKKSIYLIGSSSGGHVFPLIGIYELLKKDYNIKFVGIKNKFEQAIYPFDSIFLEIENSFKKINKNKKVFKDEINRLKNIIKKDDIVISGGGISSYIASKLNNKNLILLEQNRIIGDSNLYSGIKAKKILTSFDLLYNPYFYKTEKIINPSIHRLKNNSVVKENQIVFIFGSLSSSTLIDKTVKYFNSNLFIKDYKYIFVCGKYINDIKKLKLHKNIYLYEKITDFEILKKSKLVFTRAGGTTLSELLYYEIPFLNIPSPYVKHNHQLFNAKYLKKKYNIPYVLEENYSEKIIYETISNTNDKNEILWYKKENNIRNIKDIIDEIL